MEPVILIIFCIILIGSIVLNISLIPALLAGLVLFLAYGRWKKHTGKELVQMCWSGIYSARKILMTFILIGMMTALWRSSGCIPSIVCYASGLIHPSSLLLLTFLLTSLVSVLTGTAFGTAATMGVICGSIARSMNMNLFWIGGAMLAGCYFGDRCSPVSTSALLVSTLTDSDLYQNIRNMVRTSIVPFLVSCGIYLLIGIRFSSGSGPMDVTELFSQEFQIHWICILPAAIIIVLALFHIKVMMTMMVSILISLPIACLVQGVKLRDLFLAMLTGYHAASPDLTSVINGGGITSMVRVGAIVCIASCYSGIFKGTGLLDFMQKYIEGIAGRYGNFAAYLLIGISASAVACNQTLAIMLTSQMTEKLQDTKETRAVYLENSAVVIAPLIPWCIAGSTPLAMIDAPSACIFVACYLYLLPLWQLFRSRHIKDNHK